MTEEHSISDREFYKLQSCLERLEKNLVEIKDDIRYIKATDLKDIRQNLRDEYLTYTQFYALFRPVQVLIYGFVSSVLLAFVGGLIAYVFKGAP